MHLGIHGSIAGGYYRACEEAASLGCGALQIFTKNQVQWKARPITKEDAARFREARAKAGLRFVMSHCSYLINLASLRPALYRKSVESFEHEIERAFALGLDFLVLHPGSPGEGAEEEGRKRTIRALRGAGKGAGVQILLETSAGQGATLGRSFEDLARLLEASDRLGVCFDTCHVFAAGYDLSEGYERTLEEFDRAIGLRRIRAFHLNDSKKGLGSRIDRHEHIGAGAIGTGAFRKLLRDPRFADRPMVIETPKDPGMDKKNLDLLRRLAKGD